MALLTRRVLLIVNPAARRASRLGAAATRAFQRAGVACDLVLSEHPGHGGDVALERAARYDAVFALGGDGTIMEVAGALAGTGLPIGILAAGTGNLLARALGIPRRVEKAIPVLLRGKRLLVDLGRMHTGRRFAIAAGVGIDATMVRETPPWLKRRLGVLAYMLMGTRAALRAVLRRQYFHARVTVDGTVHERPAAAVMVANFGAVLGRRIILGPGIETDDGLLDMCVFSPDTLGDALRIMWRLVRADFRSDPCMLYGRGRELTIETTPAHVFQADGEMIGVTPFSVSVEPKAACLLVPE